MPAQAGMGWKNAKPGFLFCRKDVNEKVDIESRQQSPSLRPELRLILGLRRV